jgi:NitT/TauT family transport system substrate-binding protein
MPFHIAAEEGYFAEQDLEVEFLHLGRNQEIMTALALGQIDVAAGLLTVNEIGLAAAGARIRMVASLGEQRPEGCPFAAVIARREHRESGALEDAARIRQMSFDTSITLPFAYLLDVMLRDYGLTIDDVELIDLPPPAALEALSVGSIDATIDSEPFVTMNLERGDAAVWRSLGDIAPGFVNTVMMYGPTMVDERPDVARRFAVAMLQAVRQYRQGKTPRNIDIVERGTGLTRDQVERACWPKLSESAEIDPGVFRGYQEWAARRGLVDRVLEDEELFDSSFIRYADAELDGR